MHGRCDERKWRKKECVEYANGAARGSKSNQNKCYIARCPGALWRHTHASHQPLRTRHFTGPRRNNNAVRTRPKSKHTHHAPPSHTHTAQTPRKSTHTSIGCRGPSGRSLCQDIQDKRHCAVECRLSHAPHIATRAPVQQTTQGPRAARALPLLHNDVLTPCSNHIRLACVAPRHWL